MRQVFGLLLCVLTVIVAVAMPGRPAAASGTERLRVRDLVPKLVAQIGHSTGVVSVTMSPDGARVLTGGTDDTARLWDTATGALVRSFEGHSDFVVYVAFSPDGTKVLTGSRDTTMRLWDAATGALVRSFAGNGGFVLSIAISTDGTMVLTGGEDETARLWDASTGALVRSFEGHSDSVYSVRFSPDGTKVLTGSGDKTARLWDASTGALVRSFEGHAGQVRSVGFSPDGTKVLTGGTDDTARLWDAATGALVRSFEGHAGRVWSVGFSPDGTKVLTGSWDATARLWDAATGTLVRSFRGHSVAVLSVAFSADGARVLTGGIDSTARLWDTSTGALVRTFEGHASEVDSVAFSPDGTMVLSGGSDNTARLWDTSTGALVRTFEDHNGEVDSVAFSPDGTRVLTGSWDRTARLWDTSTGALVRSFEGHSDSVYSVTFSPDGAKVLTGSRDKTARLWDASTGALVRSFEGHAREVESVAFSPDGTAVLTGSEDGTARLWDASTGALVRAFEGHSDSVDSVAISPDGTKVLTGSWDKTARLWDASTGALVRAFEGHSDSVDSVAISPDGTKVLTGSWDKTARLWDASTAALVHVFEGHSSEVRSVAFSPDGTKVLTGSLDSTTRVWSTATGHELCSLISFNNGTWAVTDLSGRFDASNGGDVDGLHWIVGDEPIALSQLKDRYYEPGLLAKHMGFSREPLRDVRRFDRVALFPKIARATVAPGTSRLSLALENRGGGIGRLVVIVNGKRVLADARGPSPDPAAPSLAREIDLAQFAAFVEPGKTNAVEVRVYNADGSISSRGVRVLFDAPADVDAEPPSLWAVVVGSSDYAGDALDLNFAAKDAADFATALEVAGAGLFPGRTHVSHLTTSATEPARRPTLGTIEGAFDEVRRRAKAGDVLVVYFAGHGVSRGGEDGDYYYLTCEATSGNLDDSAVREAVALSSARLSELMLAVPALKQVLVLDTCAAGRLVDQLSKRREISSSARRALESMKGVTGTFILAGSAADRVSYEASRYGQGLLTYSLLEGMRGGALREGTLVHAGDLLAYASTRVPELARGIGGIQQPVLATPKATASFAIGSVAPSAKARIPYRQTRPVILRTSLQDEERFSDWMGLGRQLDDALRDVSARGADATVMFWDATDGPAAYALAGRYKVEGPTATLRAKLFLEGKPAGEFTVSVVGAASEDDLARRLIEGTLRELDARLKVVGP
jgi:WD40 repeat protein